MDNTNVRISIITICLNAAEVLEKTIVSVLAQKGIAFEYIIKDGGSTDTTEKIVRKYMDASCLNGRKIKYISKRDNGVYDAMNQAVESAAGEWIIFMNAGDIFYADDVLYTIFHNKKWEDDDVLYGDTIMRDISGDSVFYADMSMITYRMPFCHQSVFCTKNLLLEYPFDCKHKIVADYDFFTKVYKANKRFSYVQQLVSIYTVDGISSTKYIDKLYEQEDIYYNRGFIKHKYGLKFIVKYVEAVIKSVILRCVPMKLQLPLRRFYGKCIKKYR